MNARERFSIPGVGGIVLRATGGGIRVLVQERHKAGAEAESGMIEIPAGKIREFENIYDCLRREIREETGYAVTRIEGEELSEMVTMAGYSVLNYEPFSSSQNLAGDYPIMVQVFICHVEDRAEGLERSDEARNIRWVDLDELRRLVDAVDGLYPMHVSTLRKYLAQAQDR